MATESVDVPQQIRDRAQWCLDHNDGDHPRPVQDGNGDTWCAACGWRVCGDELDGAGAVPRAPGTIGGKCTMCDGAGQTGSPGPIRVCPQCDGTGNQPAPEKAAPEFGGAAAAETPADGTERPAQPEGSDGPETASGEASVGGGYGG